jgi:putative oxidoreductase
MKQTNLNIALLLLRNVLGILMLFHGIAKLNHGVDGIGNMLAEKGIPSFVAYGVLIGEVVAPILMIIGYRTKLAAMVFSFTMLVAALLAHSGDIFSLTEHGSWGIELQGLYFFGGIVLILTGAGKFAVSKKNKWD